MRKVEFEIDALKELDDWVNTSSRTASKILELLREISKTPFEGKGKPEPLKHGLKGFWSRRITQEHRLIYRVTDDAVSILSCKGHYT
jgi:toxin YoeB